MTCLLRAFVAKLSGRSNCEYGTKVISFNHMVNATSPKCFEIVSGNILGVSGRHLRRLNALEICDVLIEYNHDIVAKRCEKYLKNVHEQMNGSRLVFSLSIDGTKVAKGAQISHRYGAILGGSSPCRFINIIDRSDEDISIF